MSGENGQPLNGQLPPALAVEEEEEEPVVDVENGDGYEADDEGDEGWPQDPFNNEENLSILTDEEDEEDIVPQTEPIQPGSPNNNINN